MLVAFQGKGVAGPHDRVDDFNHSRYHRISHIWQQVKYVKIWSLCTGKSLSEALIRGPTTPQYDRRLFIDLPVQYMKTTSSEHGENTLCA